MIDWTQIIIHIIWAIVVIVVLIIFKKNIIKIAFKNKDFGELLVELDNKEQIIKDLKMRKQIKSLHSTDIWALQDLDLKRISGKISEMNPAQKIAYLRLIKSPFVKKDVDKLVLTDSGKKVLELVKSVEL